MVLDPRHLSRPACFHRTREGSCGEWRFQLVAAVDPRFGDVADEVARRTTPCLPTDLSPDEEGKEAYLMLLSVIAGCIKNRPLRLVMETVSRDGREAHRKLDAEYRPTCRGRHMALLKRIMRPHLNSAGSDAESLKAAALMEEAPPQVQEHLRLRSEESGAD